MGVGEERGEGELSRRLRFHCGQTRENLKAKVATFKVESLRHYQYAVNLPHFSSVYQKSSKCLKLPETGVIVVGAILPA